jgi:hypothetical protein
MATNAAIAAVVAPCSRDSRRRHVYSPALIRLSRCATDNFEVRMDQTGRRFK